MPSLSSLVVSVAVAASLNPSIASGAGRSAFGRSAAAKATNTERAKMGLLPRRASRSRVTYMDRAAGPGKVAMDSPALDAQPATVVIEEEDAATVRVATVAPDVPAVEEVAYPAAAVAVAPDAPAPAGAPDAAAGATSPGIEMPAEAPATQANVAGAPATTPAAVSEVPAPADAVAKETVAAPAEPSAPAVPADAAPAAAPAAVAVMERVVDQAGEIVVRVVGQGAAVLGEKVVCSLTDLPVLSSRRAEDGSVVQMVEDDWGLIEVQRDAVGRFISARPVAGKPAVAD